MKPNDGIRTQIVDTICYQSISFTTGVLEYLDISAI